MQRDSVRQGWLWGVALVALLVPVFVVPPIPIDETRYLAVAWNMHLNGQWLVPHLDGAAYPDKPPLLFWLINLAWALTGVHAWSARLLELVLALASLPLLGRLAAMLGASGPAIAQARWLWLGCIAFAGFAGAVMFDMLLTLCMLVAWIGTVHLARGRPAAGIGLLGLGLGLGILAKGPVSLLVGLWPALLAPWWQPPPRARAALLYGGVLAAVAIAAALALAWAMPAAEHGGPAYADAIFLRQTAGRVVESFAHNRGPAWYLPIVPLLLLPWTLALGRGAVRGRADRSPDRVMIDRFALVACVPAFLAFSFISGKQPHYLLPLLPMLTVAAGTRLAEGHWRVVGWRVGLVGLVLAGGFAVALVQQSHGVAWPAFITLGVAVVLAGGLLLRGRRALPAASAAVATLVLVALAKLAFVQALGPRYSVEPAAAQLAAAQRAGRPLLQAGRQHGLYTFAGRLKRPIPTALDQQQVAAWTASHPDGWVISSYRDFDYAASPLFTQPYLGRRLAIWPAARIAGEASYAAAAERARRAAATAGLQDER